MNFSERIIMANKQAPDGWKQKLSLEEYALIDADKKKYYAPLFAKYRTKKIRDYDPDYGNFVGWRPISVGVGAPIGYEYVGYMAAKMIDNALSSNVLMSRIMKGKK